VPAAEAGKSLYAEYCAECHGTDGNGLVPNARNFVDQDYMHGETPSSFYQVITEGRGADMPDFGEQLSSDERWDLAYYVWRFSTDEGAIDNGREIYNADCVSCHGEDGRSMILGAADFSDQRFMSNRSPSDLFLVVTQGKGSMPAWQARLSQDERWQVIDYINTFSYDPTIDAEEDGEAAIATPVPEAIQVERPECASYLDQTLPYDWEDKAAVSAGENLYKSCTGCHGEDGAGAVPGVPDFSSPLFKTDLQDNTNNYLCSIAEGLNAMPSYKSSMSADEIWQVLVYIKTLEN
jgi:mono/diheme cytochrome c family protein